MKLNWLGSMSSYGGDAYLMLLNPDTPIKSVDDIRAGAPGKITLGANNAASSNLIFGIIAKEALNLNVNVVRGYTGAAPMFLAMQRKEIDGQFVGISSVKTGQRAMWEKRAFKVPVLFGRTSRHPDFADVPTGRELTKDPAMLSLIDFAEIPFFMSLPFVAPPGVPADRVKALQEAFMAMCRDKAVLEEGRAARHRDEPDRRRRDPAAGRPHGGDAERRHRALQRARRREGEVAVARFPLVPAKAGTQARSQTGFPLARE